MLEIECGEAGGSRESRVKAVEAIGDIMARTYPLRQQQLVCCSKLGRGEPNNFECVSAPGPLDHGNLSPVPERPPAVPRIMPISKITQ